MSNLKRRLLRLEKRRPPSQPNAVNAELEREFGDAYDSGDPVAIGRSWNNLSQGRAVDIADDEAMAIYEGWKAIVDELEAST